MVLIKGRGFKKATAVRFGEASAESYKVNSQGTEITARTPRHANGQVDVTVVTPKGTSQPTPQSRFVYAEAGWTPVPGTSRFNHTATLLADGRVLVAGGCVKGNPAGACVDATDSAELYDPAARTWAPAAKMNEARPGGARSTANHTATLLGDGRVLVTGGKTAELFDPTTNTWTPTGAPRNGFVHSATLLPNGKVLRVDGRTGITELFDPALGTWTVVGPQGFVERAYHTATLLSDGRVLVAGGASPAALFDSATNTLVPTADIEIPRAYHTATVLADGKVLVVGGRDESSEATATAEMYDPTAVADPAKPEVKGAWSPVRPLSLARYAHTATLLPNGKVLVAGGSQAYGNVLTSAELYDPASGRWELAAPMNTGRGGSIPTGGGQQVSSGVPTDQIRPRGSASFTATALKDNSVLVAGGTDATAGEDGTLPLASAELYGAVTLPESKTEPEPTSGSRSAAALGAVLVVGVLAVVGVVIVLRRRRSRKASEATSDT